MPAEEYDAVAWETLGNREREARLEKRVAELETELERKTEQLERMYAAFQQLNNLTHDFIQNGF